MFRPAFSVVVLLLSVLSGGASAQVQKFPYEASVSGEDVYLRSGPGKKYYPTGRLKSGDRVIVHRHDPGGWYMVAPPQGSFSMVRADAVRPLGSQRGLITANNVPVLVGSALGEAKEVEQVRLSTNEEVQLYDEVPVTIGGLKVYRIVPPRGEYRWVLGQFITPSDPLVRQQHDKDPFATPSAAKPKAGESAVAGTNPEAASIDIDDAAAGFGAEPKPSSLTRATPTPSGNAPRSAEAVSTPDAERFRAERQRLADLDNGLRAMLAGDVSTWQLEPYDQAYRQLAQSAALPTMARQIEPRLATIAQHRELKREYDEFVRVTEVTNQRDAALVAQLGGRTTTAFRASPPTTVVANPGTTNVTNAPAGNPQDLAAASPFSPPAAPGTTPLNGASAGAANETFLPPVVQEPAAVTQNLFSGPSFAEPPMPNPFENLAADPMTPVATSPNAVPAAPIPPANAAAAPQFSGAGIVQKTQPIAAGAPSYVLVSPQGKVLAFLQPQAGVNLDSMVGKPMGIVGPRVRRPDLRGDLISVQDASPVRLAPR